MHDHGQNVNQGGPPSAKDLVELCYDLISKCDIAIRAINENEEAIMAFAEILPFLENTELSLKAILNVRDYGMDGTNNEEINEVLEDMEVENLREELKNHEITENFCTKNEEIDESLEDTDDEFVDRYFAQFPLSE